MNSLIIRRSAERAPTLLEVKVLTLGQCDLISCCNNSSVQKAILTFSEKAKRVRVLRTEHMGESVEEKSFFNFHRVEGNYNA